MKIFIVNVLILALIGCSIKEDNVRSTVTVLDSVAQIDLGYDIKIVIPNVGSKFDTCIHYTHIEVWKKDKIIFRDTTDNEYMFMCNKTYTTVRQLYNSRYEVLIEKFDGPDTDKTLALYLNGDNFESEKILPYFETAVEKVDGKDIYHGVLHTIDGYNNDSCYYNPTLYYQATYEGLMLDTVLTKRKVVEKWGKFYGYEQSDKIILPCKR